MTRVQVLHALLNMVPSHPELRPVRLDLPGWDRLEDVAHRLSVPLEDILTKLLSLASQCSADELLQLIGRPESESTSK